MGSSNMAIHTRFIDAQREAICTQIKEYIYIHIYERGRVFTAYNLY